MQAQQLSYTMAEQYIRRLVCRDSASESLSQMRDCNKVHQGVENPTMRISVCSLGFADIVNVAMGRLYCTSKNGDFVVTSKAVWLIWKCYYYTLIIQLSFLTVISSSANKQLFLSLWDVALKYTRSGTQVPKHTSLLHHCTYHLSIACLLYWLAEARS